MNIAFVIHTFNRPDFTEKCIRNVENCTQDVDFHLFQDGAINKFSGVRKASDKKIQKNLEILKNANLPNKKLHINSYNLCTAHQMDKMFKLFDDYDYIIHIEDDVAVCNNYIKLIKKAINQFDNIILRMNGPKLKDKDDLNKLTSCKYGSWAMVYPKMVWSIIRDDWHDFMDIVGDIDFWPGKNRRAKKSDEIRNRFQVEDGMALAHDGVIRNILLSKGVDIYHPKIGRCYNFGNRGINVTPKQFAKNKQIGRMKINFEYDEDFDEWIIED